MCVCMSMYIWAYLLIKMSKAKLGSIWGVFPEISKRFSTTSFGNWLNNFGYLHFFAPISLLTYLYSFHIPVNCLFILLVHPVLHERPQEAVFAVCIIQFSGILPHCLSLEVKGKSSVNPSLSSLCLFRAGNGLLRFGLFPLSYSPSRITGIPSSLLKHLV
jgi:hypothetical protein